MKWNKVVNGVNVDVEISPSEYDEIMNQEIATAMAAREKEAIKLGLERKALQAMLKDDSSAVASLKAQWKSLDD